ncbi:MAG: 2OG-Fe(II) oxygenase [Bryobacteraceae bacterium]
MKYIEVEYNRELNHLEALLSEVKHPGDFFVAGVLEIPMPRVEVEGAGTLSFPIPRPQIEAMVQLATRAPYGRGEETIVDTSVRNVWQIAPGAVKISGKSWATSFENILSKVTAGLGCQDAKVSAELYKLLVYDRGGFFLAHRDTEKTTGMFGTLVVTLPSTYRGGSLRIRHGDREVTVETDAADPSEISFAAFYADCEHEALPVREGNRVCLVYNLIQERKKSGHRVLKAPNYGVHVAKAAAVLEEYWSSPDAPPKIAWLLDHQYSPAGLSFSSLKGADAAKSRVLVHAAAQAQCVAHLGVVHIGETGGAEEDGGYYYNSRRSRYRDYDQHDEEEESEDEDSDDEDMSFTAVTVDDAWQYLDEWRDTDDRVVEFGRIPLTEGELLPAGALDDEPPDDKRLTEASGNEGATYERSYHRAALVLWPANRMIDVLLEAGVVATLPYLKRLAAGGKSARPEAIAVAQRIVEAWSAGARRPDRYPIDITSAGSSARAVMIAVLVELNAPALLEQFIRAVVTSTYDGSENAALLTSVNVLGDVRAAAVLSALVGKRMPHRPIECAELLLTLTADPSPPLRQVAEAAVAGLDGIGMPGSKPDNTFEPWQDRKDRRQCNLEPEFIANLFSGLQHFKDRTLCDAAASKIASRPDVFNPTTLVVPAIERICAERDHLPPAVDRAIQNLWTSAAEFLLLRSEVPPQPPSDWRLHAELSCSCADCRELQAFARDPAERVHRFRVKKERRSHLHRAIDRHRLDMTHVTERVGSPQTLVCTKDRRTFKARMKEYQNEIAAMCKLVKLAPKSAAAAALSKRMEAAVKASTI